VLSTHIFPPMCSTSRRQIARPSPRPLPDSLRPRPHLVKDLKDRFQILARDANSGIAYPYLHYLTRPATALRGVTIVISLAWRQLKLKAS